MGTYKVIQDIEAEDTIIGWMTPRQAVYAAIVIVSGFICFMLVTRGAWWIAVPFLPHMVLFSVLAGPFVHDQPSEVWLLAKIKFFLKPRRRIWDQSGLKELVTITVPKKIERKLTDGLTQSEVKSRLQALANTIDSRGWAVKNVNMNLYAQPAYVSTDSDSDRLIDHASIPQQVPDYDTYASDDILDPQNNPVAQQVQQMVSQSAQAHREQLIKQMQQSGTTQQPATQQWFVDPPTQTSTVPTNNPAEEQLAQQLKENKQHGSTGQMAAVSPTSGQLQHPRAKQPVDRAVVGQLAQNNDLNISTIARQARKKEGDDEVVISLR